MRKLSRRKEIRFPRFPDGGGARRVNSGEECMAILDAYIMTPDLSWGHSADHVAVLTYVCARRHELLHSLRGIAKQLHMQRSRIKDILKDLKELELLTSVETGKGMMLAPLVKPWMLQVRGSQGGEISELSSPDTGG